MQVQFQHDKKTTGIFSNTTHSITLTVEFTEEELFLIDQMNLMDTDMFEGPTRNFLGNFIPKIYKVRDLVAGPITIDAPDAALAHQAQVNYTESLTNLKAELYNNTHDPHRIDAFEI